MIRYEIVNMFTERPFGGSPLGVVPQADGLSTEAMVAIARELNTTETVFVLPPSRPDATYRVRVFTPEAESPFGGHSSIGTGATLARLGEVTADPVVQECGRTLLQVTVAEGEASITARRPLATTAVDRRPLLASVGLVEADLADAEPGAAGFGPAFHFLPVHAASVSRARLDTDALSLAGLDDVFVFSWDASQRTADARMFAPGYGIPEDPGCASAGLGLAVWLFDAGWLPASDGRHTFRIRQGVQMGRAATLTCSVTVVDGRTTTASVSGCVTHVAEGRITIPPPTS